MTVMDQRINHSVLEAVLRPTQPAAAVYLGAPPDVANEYRLSWETRWGPLAASLRGQGADEADISALEKALEPQASSRAARGSGQVAGFARGGQVVAVVATPGWTGPDHAAFGSPAHVVPLLQWQQERPPYVLCVTDRAGADLETCIGAGCVPMRASVDGPDDEIERNAPGGWEGLAQGRYQRRAEDSWAHNAAAVAEAVTSAVHSAEARTLVIGGDVRAVQLLKDKLPTGVLKRVTVKEIHAGRSADGSEKGRPELVEAAVRAAVDEQTAALWERFLEERSPHGLAVEGAHETIAALSGGRVATLFVSADAVAGKAWFGPAATDVVPVGAGYPVPPDARKGPLVDVAVRAAVLTGADVRVIPVGAGFWPMEGVAGICRFH